LVSHANDIYWISRENKGYAFVVASPKIHEGRFVGVIEEFQGVASKKELAGFKQMNGGYWSDVLVSSVANAFSNLGFHEVWLRDVTTTTNYRAPAFLTVKSTDGKPKSHWAELNERQKAMKTLNWATGRKCGFEGRNGDYFVKTFNG